MRRATVPAALGAALVAAGCGQKGPLYLPDRNPRVVTTPAAQPQPAPAAPAEEAPVPPAAPPTTPAKPDDKSGDAATPK